MEVTLPLDCKHSPLKTFDDASTCSPSTPIDDDAVFSFDIVESAACVLRDRVSSERPKWLDAALATAPWRQNKAWAAAADRYLKDHAVGAANLATSPCCSTAPSEILDLSPATSYQTDDAFEGPNAIHPPSVPLGFGEDKQGPRKAEADPQEPTKVSKREKHRRAKAKKEYLTSIEMAQRATLARQNLQDRASVTMADIGLLPDKPKSELVASLPAPVILSTKPCVALPLSVAPTLLSSNLVSPSSGGIAAMTPDRGTKTSLPQPRVAYPPSAAPTQPSSNRASQNNGGIAALTPDRGGQVFSGAHFLELGDNQATRMVIPVAMPSHPRREFGSSLPGPHISSWIQNGLQQARMDLTAVLQASAPEVYED